MTALLAAEGLVKAFGGTVAVDHVSFALAGGEMLALIGPNGAGKSTCFNLLNGQLSPDAGRVLLDGIDTTRWPPRRRWRAGMGRSFQIAAIFASMSVIENVQTALIARAGETWRFGRPASGYDRNEALALLDELGIAALAENPAGALAYGDVKRLELAIALAGAPRLLLMDEPTAGMELHARGELMSLVGALARDRGMGVLFTEHDMDMVFSHAHRILVLHRGLLIADGDPASILADVRVKAVYLGDS